MLRFDSCPNCFALLNGREECPECGYDYSKDKKQPKGVLEPFTLLCGRYLIGRVLGKGGFGVTYVSMDIESNRLLAVKEYMPTEYSSRGADRCTIRPKEDKKARYIFVHGRDKFVEEAKTLYALRGNPVVVDIADYFSENNTAYLVMEYLDGSDLRRMSKENGGKIDAELAKAVFVTVASALVEVHKKNILHRDLSPENIFVTKDHDIKLIDFGAARNYVKVQDSGMSILLKPGFAPPEQYSASGIQGPWTDVYGLCATFYTLVSGKQLVDAMYRYRGEHQPTLFELGCPVTKQTSDVIAKGMELDAENRYKGFPDLLSELDVDLEKLNVYSKSNLEEKRREKEKLREAESVERQEKTPAGEKPADGVKTPESEPAEKPERAQDAAEDKASPEKAPDRESGDNLAAKPAEQVENPAPPADDGTVRVADGGSPARDGFSRKEPEGASPRNGSPVYGGGFHSFPSDRRQSHYFENTDNRGGAPDRRNMRSDPNAGFGQQGAVRRPPESRKRGRPWLGISANGRIVCSIPLIPDREMKIGRSKECDFIVGGDTNISRVHCVLRFDSARGLFFLTDKSSNGTFFDNNVRLNRGMPYSVKMGSSFYLVTPNHRLTIFEN